MKTSQTSILSKKKYTFNIVDSINMEVEVVGNPWDLPIEDLFTMAARINKKRSFLFVSKVLGKHLPIEPGKGLLTAALLAATYAETVQGIECREKEGLLESFYSDKSTCSSAFIPADIHPLVIGFAETATALGHAFFDCFEAADFFHTTREDVIGNTAEIMFEEEHSHATSHRCYVPLALLANQREIILVDDEMTTGKTALNIIRSIQTKFPRQVYTVVSILDWRSLENQQKFLQLEEELAIKINVVSLLSGLIHVKRQNEIGKRTEAEKLQTNEGMTVEKIFLSSYFQESPYHPSMLSNAAPFINATGRFGLSSLENRAAQEKLASAAAFLKERRTGKKTLCLGTGELMYLPMKLAAQMGEGISYQSTTRSPIYVENEEGYGARFGISFPNPEDHGVVHFVYNIPPGQYEDLFIFFEREVDEDKLQPMLRELEKTAIKSIKLVFFSKA